MNLDITTSGSTMVITLVRRFDAETAPEVESELKRILQDSPKSVLFDFSRTEYVASAGLRVLLSAARTIKKYGGAITLCSLSPQVRHVFEIGGFVQIFTIYSSRDEALAHMRVK